MNIQTVKFNDISFIDVANPQELEIKYLRKTFEFDALHLDDYLTKTQISQIETYEKYTVVVLDFPTIQPAHNDTKTVLDYSKTLLPIPTGQNNEKIHRITITQINFFIGKDFLVALHDENHSPINDVFAQCQKTLRNREEYLGKGPIYLLYTLVDKLIDNCFPLLNNISSSIDKIDRELDEAKTDTTLENISVTRRNIVVMQTLIKPLFPLFRHIEEGKYQELDGYMKPYWSNVVDHTQKILERLEDNRELLEGIVQSNESLIASKTNEVIKVLTVFSAILLPLNLFASIYGMNIDGLPHAHLPDAFLMLMLTMAIITVALLLFFKLKRWF